MLRAVPIVDGFVFCCLMVNDNCVGIEWGGGCESVADDGWPARR